MPVLGDARQTTPRLQVAELQGRVAAIQTRQDLLSKSEAEVRDEERSELRDRFLGTQLLLDRRRARVLQHPISERATLNRSATHGWLRPWSTHRRGTLTHTSRFRGLSR